MADEPRDGSGGKNTRSHTCESCVRIPGTQASLCELVTQHREEETCGFQELADQLA